MKGLARLQILHALRLDRVDHSLAFSRLVLGDSYRLKDKQKVGIIGSQAGMEVAAV